MAKTGKIAVWNKWLTQGSATYLYPKRCSTHSLHYKNLQYKILDADAIEHHNLVPTDGQNYDSQDRASIARTVKSYNIRLYSRNLLIGQGVEL